MGFLSNTSNSIRYARPFVRSIRQFAVSHKLASGAILLCVLGGGWWAYGKATAANAETRYVLGTVEKGTIVQSVSASGQVSASNQIDIKPKAAGEVTWVGVEAGATIRAGQAIGQIDNADAKQAVADAENSLAQAKLQYQKDSAQAPIDYQKALESLDEAKADLKTTYNDTYNTLSDAYLDLPATVTGMQNILYGYDFSAGKSQWNIDVFKNDAVNKDTFRVFADAAEHDYKAARDAYDAAALAYKTLSRYSSAEDTEALLSRTIDTTTAIAQALQSELNMIDVVIDDASAQNRSSNAAVTTMRANIRSYLSSANSTLSGLLNQQKSLDSSKKSIRDNERSIEIYVIGNPEGDMPISLQSSKQSIENQERKLQDLKNDLADYVITAPFAGTLASLDVKRGDTVSTGTTVASLLAQQRVAELSLNEVDAAKIKVGDKATLTFDAIDGLTLTGSVVEMDIAGTVSQGVVSYSLKIAFDAQDERVKPGMTVNASIITDAKQDVLVVPSSAVKTQNGASYVQVFEPTLTDTGGTQGIASSVPPQMVEVEVGISDDSNTEIVSGLSEGQQIVARTVTAAATTARATTQSATSLLGGGAGAVRAGGAGGGNANFRAR